MLSIVIILVTSATLCIILAKPKWGSFLIWLILFTYPHAWWYYRQFLPWNIGVDDLYCITLFFVVLVRRNIIDGVPIRFGYAFWMMTSFLFIGVISSISGSTYAPGFHAPLYIKEALKHGIFWMLFYAILHCIDDVEDLKKQFKMFSVAAVAGTILVILHYFYPATIGLIFGSPNEIEEMGIRYRYRAMGSFGDQNGAACVLTCCLIFIVTTIRLHKKIAVKILAYGCVFLMFLGVMVTKSRSGLMTLVGSFLLMSFFGKTKKLAWLVIISGIVVVLLAPNIREGFKRRFVKAYDPETGAVGVSVRGRFGTWKGYFETATPQIYIFGQGFTQGAARNEGETHSAYVSLITVYGIGSFIWAVLGVIIFFKKIFGLRSAPDPLLSIVAIGCFWSLIAWGIYGITADAIMNQYTRYLLFYWVVLVDRASVLAGEQQEYMIHSEEVEYGATPLQAEEVY